MIQSYIYIYIFTNPFFIWTNLKNIFMILSPILRILTYIHEIQSNLINSHHQTRGKVLKPWVLDCRTVLSYKMLGSLTVVVSSLGAGSYIFTWFPAVCWGSRSCWKKWWTKLLLALDGSNINNNLEQLCVCCGVRVKKNVSNGLVRKTLYISTRLLGWLLLRSFWCSETAPFNFVRILQSFFRFFRTAKELSLPKNPLGKGFTSLLEGVAPQRSESLKMTILCDN